MSFARNVSGRIGDDDFGQILVALTSVWLSGAEKGSDLDGMSLSEALSTIDKHKTDNAFVKNVTVVASAWLAKAVDVSKAARASSESDKQASNVICEIQRAKEGAANIVDGPSLSSALMAMRGFATALSVQVSTQSMLAEGWQGLADLWNSTLNTHFAPTTAALVDLLVKVVSFDTASGDVDVDPTSKADIQERAQQLSSDASLLLDSRELMQKQASTPSEWAQLLNFAHANLYSCIAAVGIQTMAVADHRSDSEDQECTPQHLQTCAKSLDAVEKTWPALCCLAEAGLEPHAQALHDFLKAFSRSATLKSRGMYEVAERRFMEALIMPPQQSFPRELASVARQKVPNINVRDRAQETMAFVGVLDEGQRARKRQEIECPPTISFGCLAMLFRGCVRVALNNFSFKL